MVQSTRENTPEWAKSLLLAQKASDVRLEKLEKVVKHHGQKSTNDSLSGHKFKKKLYEEQHDFNLKVLRHLQNVASLDSSVGRDDIEAGMSLINEQNKFLVLADSFGWDVALCYAKELLAEDSEDERKIRKAKKEGKIRRDKRLKSKLKPRRYSPLYKHSRLFQGFVGSPQWTFNRNHVLALQETRTLCSFLQSTNPTLQFWTSTWAWWKVSKPQYWSLEQMFL